MNEIVIYRGAEKYPDRLDRHLFDHTPEAITAIGNLDLLCQRKFAIFSSRKCPGSLILKTHDLAQHLRHSGAIVISGFQSPMERECLRVLLRGSGALIVCPARSIVRMRIRAELRQPLEQGRLLFLSPFPKNLRRPTAQAAHERNRFVAALAEEVLIAHADPNGKMMQLAQEVLGWGKPLYALKDDANAHLIKVGAIAVNPDDEVFQLGSG